jgi:endo-1,3(4)-beta-glucanase
MKPSYHLHFYYLLFALMLWLVDGNLLVPISTNPPTLFSSVTHPFRPRYNSSKISPPFATNKFNTYLLFDSPTVSPIITHPYTLKIQRDYPFGLYASHSDEKFFGGGTTDRIEYYYNVVLQNIGLSAVEFGSFVQHQVEHINEFGAEISFTQGSGSIRFPIVRGMAYVTAIYDNMTPVIYTQHAFLSINGRTPTGFSETNTKFKIELNNNQKWVIYSLSPITFRFENNRMIASGVFDGVVRVSQIPFVDSQEAEQVLDSHYKRYVTRGFLEVFPTSYTLRWESGGDSSHELLHYAHLHHQQVVSGVRTTVLVLPSTTKGDMRGLVGSQWTLTEPTLSNITWYPPRAPDSDKVATIIAQLEIDLELDFERETFLDSNYFSGKGLQKFALLCLVADYFERADLRDKCVTKLIAAFEPFLQNENINSLLYDQTWGGVVARSGLSGDPVADFGNSYYNDHHYHYGYFIHAAAILSYLDPVWNNRSAEWITTLIRDVNNPSSQDPYFVPFRNFDWFSGHSWSQGLFESGDAKDQESTSEEINYHIGVKLWAHVTNNDNLFNLANLMLAVSTRSINTYFLMDSNNVAHPKQFIGNKVTGIFFENKAHYTTWFSPRVECIHGIQMIPMLSVSEHVRKLSFMKEEWELLKNIAPGIADAWASIIYTNYAFIDKNFAFEKLKTVPTDDGLTRTWALFFAATRA